jgi:hypothetical protein
MAVGDQNRAKQNWKDIFRSMGFVPTALSGMDGRIEDIHIATIDHPILGVSVTATHIGGRSGDGGEWEEQIIQYGT